MYTNIYIFYLSFLLYTYDAQQSNRIVYIVILNAKKILGAHLCIWYLFSIPGYIYFFPMIFISNVKEYPKKNRRKNWLAYLHPECLLLVKGWN